MQMTSSTIASIMSFMTRNLLGEMKRDLVRELIPFHGWAGFPS
jgi:hypothetical protein